MNPTSFLKLGGIILVLISILGFVGVIGPTATESLFGDVWWFDNGENWAHLVLGVVALIAAYVFPMSLQKLLVMLLGIVGVLIGLYSMVVSTSFLGSSLQNPADSLLHLVVGIWALASSMKKQPMMATV